jgi:hypothetical protein
MLHVKARFDITRFPTVGTQFGIDRYTLKLHTANSPRHFTKKPDSGDKNLRGASRSHQAR